MGMAHAHNMHSRSGVKPGSSGLTLRVRRVARRASGGRRSLGMLILSVEMALSKVMGTGRMCISALPSLLMGIGLPAAGENGHCVTFGLDSLLRLLQNMVLTANAPRLPKTNCELAHACV